MAKRSVGKPRFYADLGQYLKAKGYYRGSQFFNHSGFVDYEGNQNLAKNVWNMNPSQPISVELGNYNGLGFEFYIDTNLPTTEYDWDAIMPSANRELTALLKKSPEASDESRSGFYLGVLGHSLADEPIAGLKCEYWGWSGDTGNTVSAKSDEFVDGVNIPSIGHGDASGYPVEYNGYSIAHFKNFSYEDEVYSSSIFRVQWDYNEPNAVENNPDATKVVGAVSWGRWFEPEHSADLDVTLITSYEGIDEQTTIGGSSLSNINYLGSPNWGDLPPWTLEKQEGNDYNIGSQSPRRTWRIKLSYLSDTNIFNAATNENKFFTWTDPQEGTDGEPEYKFDASMASFMGLTFNGSLPFLFNPDSSADNKEFAICKIDQDSISYKQVAFRTWDVSFVIREVW